MNRTMGVLATGHGATLDAALESAYAQVKEAVADGWVVTTVELTRDAEAVVRTSQTMGVSKIEVTVYVKFTVKEHTS